MIAVYSPYREAVRNALPGSAVEIQIRTGVNKSTVWRWLHELHSKKEAHINGWARSRTNGPYSASYALGPGVDLPLPKPQRKAQRIRQQQECRIARPNFSGVTKKDAASWPRGEAKRDPLVAALFGGAA